MAIDQSLKPWQILGIAVRSEIDAESFYTRLKGRVKNVILIEKLRFLALEEAHHRQMIERLLKQKFPGKPADVPEKSLIPLVAADLDDRASVPDLFAAALRAEEVSEAFYEEAGELAADEGSRRMLAYLGRVERSHQAMIKSELALIEKFPDYYDVEDFHIAQDLFHVGP